jgi:hypothetical protein
MEMMQGKSLLVAAFGAAAVIVAVDRSGAQGAAPAAAETWTLAQVDGGALPLVVDTDGPCRDELVSGTLTLADGAWTLDTVERVLCDGRAAAEDRESERGRYTLAGAAVTFTDEDDADDDDARPDADDPGHVDVDVDELAAGTVNGATLTVRLRTGRTVVFRR